MLADDTGVVHTGNHFYLEMISLDSFISVIDDKSRSSIRDARILDALTWLQFYELPLWNDWSHKQSSVY